MDLLVAQYLLLRQFIIANILVIKVVFCINDSTSYYHARQHLIDLQIN